MYVPNTLWTRLFLATAVIQGVLALTLEALVPSPSRPVPSRFLLALPALTSIR